MEASKEHTRLSLNCLEDDGREYCHSFYQIDGRFSLSPHLNELVFCVLHTVFLYNMMCLIIICIMNCQISMSYVNLLTMWETGRICNSSNRVQFRLANQVFLLINGLDGSVILN